METLGSLIDKSTIVEIRIGMAEGIKHNKKATDKQIADATRLTDTVNQLRNDLTEEINDLTKGLSKAAIKSLKPLSTKLWTVNMQIWMAEDVKRDEKATDKQIADATRLTNRANQLRNDLIEEIDEFAQRMSNGTIKFRNYKQGSTKMYGKK